MTYPIDDAGNPRVDFVWGNMPLQPDQQRDGDGWVIVDDPNTVGNRGWSETRVIPSDHLQENLTVSLSVGDQSYDAAWDNVTTRSVSVKADNHTVATTGYSNFPAYIPNYAGDDNPVLNALVPTIEGLGESAAHNLLEAAGFAWSNDGTTSEGATEGNNGNVHQITTGIQSVDTVVHYQIYANTITVPSVVDFDSVSAAEAFLISEGLTLGTVTTSTVGATYSNWNWVKSQTPASGAQVAPGTAVDLVSYNYVSSATSGSIAGFTRNGSPMGWSLNGTEAIMFVTGRQNWPAISSTFAVSGTSNSTYNQNWTVVDVKPDNSYNTGGTAIKVAAAGTFTGNTSTGGTWAPPLTPIISANSNWAYRKGTVGMDQFSTLYFGDSQLNTLPSDLINSPDSFSVVISGSGPGITPGTYQVRNAANAMPGMYPPSVQITFEAMGSSNLIGESWSGSSGYGTPVTGVTIAVVQTSPLITWESGTTRWYSEHNSNSVHFNGIQSMPSALQSSPTSYKLVVTGGNYPGEYAISSVRMDMIANHLVVTTATHFGGSGMMDPTIVGSSLSPNAFMGVADAGLVQIVHI